MTPARENDGSVQELIAANTHLSPHRKLPSPETTKTAESSVAPTNVLSPPLGTVVGNILASPSLGTAADGPEERRRRAVSEGNIEEERIKRRYKHAYSFWHA